MQNISVSDFNYLIFVIPGFITVWTFRYFTRSKNKGDFELVAWSFVWGSVFFFVPMWIKQAIEGLIPDIPLNNIGALYGVMLGLSIFAPFFGFIGAWLVNQSLFRLIQRGLFWCVEGDKKVLQKQHQKCYCKRKRRYCIKWK